MSYILDALRKSEHQRQIGEVPRVHTLQDGYAAEPVRRNPWILVAVVALLANIGIGGWLWWQHQQSASQQTASVPAAAAPTPTAPTVATSTTPLAPVEHPGATSARRATAAHAPPQAAPELEDVVVFESIKTPSAPAPKAAQRFNDLVDISELPGQLHIAMLALELNVHVYDDDPAKRFVLIDMKRYAEGHALPQGPVIEAITPDGVVLAYQGQRFMIRQN